MSLQSTSHRLDVVDALRGFALASIIILHNIEHFDLYFHPKNGPSWLVLFDKAIWDGVFFLINGKSYGIFSLLFGFTFFLQFSKQAEKGYDFRLRFAWRMVILFIFGIINSAFFEGDILTFYAAIGLILIPLVNVRTSILLLIATLLLLDPVGWFKVIEATLHPGIKITDPESWQYFNQSSTYLAGESTTSTWIGNLTNGKMAIVYWFWETGRFMQTPAFFILGMIIGRKALFAKEQEKIQQWKRILRFSTIVIIPLLLFKLTLSDWFSNTAILEPMHQIITSWFNFFMMMMIASLFVYLWQKSRTKQILSIFIPLGRMSLSNYVLQSIMGAYIYYGIGLGLYKYTGALFCLIIGLTCIIFQITISILWLKTHNQGPLEYLWHKLTWLSCKKCKQLIGQLFPNNYSSTKRLSED